jgi:hypothetical protein
MCWEKLTDTFEETEARAVETPREEELARPDVLPEPSEEPEEVREREYAHV